MMKHIAILLAFLMTIGSQVVAFDSADLQRLIDTKKCSKCYLTDTDLYRANLAGANLAGANLAGANTTLIFNVHLCISSTHKRINACRY